MAEQPIESECARLRRWEVCWGCEHHANWDTIYAHNYAAAVKEAIARFGEVWEVRTGAADEPGVDRGAEWAERERWIRRFVGHFGEPGCLSEYRAHRITFRELYDGGMRMAENMLAEAQSVHSCAFCGVGGGEEGDVTSEPRNSPNALAERP